MTTRRIFSILIATSLIFLLPACSDDDDPVDPGGGNGGTVTDPVGQVLQEEVPALAKDIVAMVPALATGQLGGKDAEDPYFDETCTCWRWSEYDGEYSDNSYWESSTSYAVTFYAEEVPQMLFEGSDRTEVSVSHTYYESDYTGEGRPPQDKYSTKTVTYNLNGEITMISEGVAQVSGSGTGQLSGGTGVGDEWEGYSEEFDISLYMTQPLTQCPTGELDFDMEAVSFSVAFDGSSTALWFYSVGPGDPTTGTFPIPCGSR
jgi:hypothetical protein